MNKIVKTRRGKVMIELAVDIQYVFIGGLP
jgi:hypothetical protein